MIDKNKVSISADGEIYYDGERRPEPAPKKTKKEQRDIIGIERFYREIPDEEAAIAFVEDCIWQGSPWCPRCYGDNVYRVESNKPLSHRCRDCKRYFSVYSGTVMEATNLPLRKWLLATHLMLTDRKGVSSVQLAKHLDIGQHAAWFLEHRVREAMAQDAVELKGAIQVDEVYIGGRERWKHARKKLHKRWQQGKITVIGFKESGIGGKVRSFPIWHADNDDLLDAVLDNVSAGSTVYTDRHDAYRLLSQFGYRHHAVSHGVGEYVRGDVTTNGIESYWACVRGTHRGTFHHVLWRHLHRYMVESDYRQNSGHGNGFRAMRKLLRLMVGTRITYEKLTGVKANKRRRSTE